MDKKKIIGIIPARSGSKGIPKKNIKLLNGKPMIYYTIDAAKKSKFLDRVIVSTDDEEIAKIAKSYGAEVPFIRPKELAQDTTPDLPVLQHALKWLEENENYKADIIVKLAPTSPLRSTEDIDSAIEMLLKTKASSLRSVSEVTEHPYWMKKVKKGRLFPIIKNKTEKKYTRRQLLPKFYKLDGVVDITTYSLLKSNKLYEKHPATIIMPLERAIDINTLVDFKIAELMLNEKKGK